LGVQILWCHMALVFSVLLSGTFLKYAFQAILAFDNWS